MLILVILALFIGIIYVKRKLKSNILESLTSQLPPHANFTESNDTTSHKLYPTIENDDNDGIGAPTCEQNSFVFDDAPPNPINQEGNTNTMGGSDDYCDDNYSKPGEYQEFGRDN